MPSQKKQEANLRQHGDNRPRFAWRLALIGGLLWQEPSWAQGPALPQVVTQGAPQVLPSVPAVGAPQAQPSPAQPSGAASKPAEKTVSFNMEGQRWSAVFQWLVDQTGLKYGSSYLPQGSFTFKSPNDRKYTISEVIDIINEALDSNPDQQRYILIRRETSFVLVPADEKIDPTLVPRVAVEDLERRGSTEVVSLVISLNTAVAEDIAPELKKLMGKYGDVVPLGRANQLVLQDTAGNLKRLLRIVKEMEDADKGQDSLTHECKFIKAREAERILTSLLGANASSAAAQPQQPFDPRRGPMPVAPMPARSRNHYVASDERTNTVIVTGPADKIAQAREILKRIDAGGPGQQKVIIGPPLLKQYPVAPGTAEPMAKTLSDVYKANSTIRISAIGNASIMVYAGPEDQMEIARQIQGTAAIEKITKTELIPLGGDAEASKVADSLKGMLGDVKTGAPYVEADTVRNAIVVRGTAEQVLDVQSIIKALGTGGIGGGTVRVINIEKGSASLLAEHLQKLMSGMRQNPVQVINPTAVPGPAPAPQPKPPVLPPMPPQRQLPPGMGRLGDPQPVDGIVRVAAQVPAGAPQPIAPAAQGKPGRADSPLRISVIGNRLVMSCEDTEALALANEIVRVMTQSPAGDGDYEIIRLRNASAAQVAKILDEAFNGPAQGSGQQGGGGLGGALGGRFGGLLSLAGVAPSQTSPNRIRVVADPASNTLLVRANPLDMLSIKSLLEKALDNADSDSNAVPRTWTIGPLVNTTANEVATTIRDVYSEYTRARSGSSSAGGFRGFGFFPPFGGSGGSQDSSAANRAPSLSIGVDERSNSLLLFCSQALYEDIGKLVDYLELSAKPTATKSVKVISVKGIDPALLQQAVDAIQGRTGARRQGTSSGTGTGTGTGGFGTGGGGFNPGGFGTGGRRGGGMGGMGGNRAPANTPELFKGQVRHEGPLFDPQAITQVAYVSEETAQQPGMPPAGQPRPAVALPGQPAAEQPSVGFSGLPGGDAVKGPKEQVTVESLPQLGVLILSGSTAADVDAMIKIIETIQRLGVASDLQIQLVELEQADATSVSSTLTDLYKAVVVGATGNSRAQPRQNAPGQPQQQGGGQQGGGFPFNLGGGNQGGSNQGGGQQSSNRSVRAETTDQLSSVVLVPVPRLNSIIVAAPKARIDEVIKDLKKLDIPVSNKLQATPIPLTKASASRVATLINNFYAQRYPGEQQIEHQVRVTHDDSSNTVFVQASPADMVEIKELVKRIDTSVSSAVNEMRIVPLRYAFSDDLAILIQRAISQGVLAPTLTSGLGQGGVGGQGGGAGGQGGFGGQGGLGNLFGGGQGGGFGQQQNQQNRTGTTGAGAAAQFKSTSLRFVGTQRDGKPVQSGMLEDIYLTSDARINSLIISAPEKSLELVMSLIKELDVPPAARSEINIFQLRKADAVITANIVQQLFLGSAGQRTGATGGQAGGAGGAGGLTGFGAQGGQGGLGAQGGAAGAAGQGRPLQFSNLSQPSPGGPLIDLRLTVDERSNSIIAAGSRSDLDVIEAIITRLEDADIQGRKNDVYILRNSVATDVAAALTNFMTSTLRNLQSSQQLTSYQQLEREVIIVAEPISNKLLISATPRWHGEIMRLVAELDAEQPQVVIQVLIADVKLSGSEDFGVEIGLQSPVLFKRTVYNPASGAFAPATGVVNSSGSSLSVTNAALTTQPGYNFLGNPSAFPGSNPAVDPSVVGFQGINALGTGRVGANGVGGFVFSAAADSFNLLIRALKTQRRIDVLSRPQVTTLDNQQARVFVGQNYPLLLGSNVTATGVINNNIQYQAVGVELLVTPKITPDGRVIMRLSPQISKPAPTTIPIGTSGTNGSTQFATAIDQQIIETTVVAMDGETVALGGLIQKTDIKSENKIPWFGDLPYVGAAFRFRTQTKEKRELLLILTPHIVRNKWDAARILNEEAKKMDWVLGDVSRMHTGQGLLPPVMPNQNGQVEEDGTVPPPGILSVPPGLPANGGSDSGKPGLPVQPQPSLPPATLPQPAQPVPGPMTRGGLPQQQSAIQQTQAFIPTAAVVPLAQARPLVTNPAPVNSAPMSAPIQPVQQTGQQETASWPSGKR